MKKFGFASVASALLTATIGFGVAAGVSGCTGANPAAYVCAEGKVWSNSLQDCVVKMPAGQTDGGNNNHIGSICSFAGNKNIDATEICLPKDGTAVTIVDGIWTSNELVWYATKSAALAINAQEKDWAKYQSVPYIFVNYNNQTTTGSMPAGKWRVFDAAGPSALWSTKDSSFINFPVRVWSNRFSGDGCNGTPGYGECTIP
jgi:hypothetical protein